MRLRRRHLELEPINVTPLIDVVMCLIIFFLLVGKLASDRGQQVRLPETKVGEKVRATDPLIVDVTTVDPGETAWLGGAARVTVAGRDVRDADALEAIIRGRLLDRPATAVEIRADRELSYGAVEPILRACGKAGAKSVRLATEKRS
ncbi:MAG: biopolymer transporter ExbD [Phycisphaeraceae bacterium]|nr:biopolymer transporter ExbD [Phycisphaeraceae bacterium]